jgi:all-trans-retinol dehydrogenase (NAD+)
MTTLPGKRVLVTGAASGIGRQLALDLARRGAVVVGWDLDRPALDSLVEEVADLGGAAHAYTCDVGDRAAVERTADLVRREVGPIDVLVNNAGVVSGRPLTDLSEEDVERTFRVNTLAHFWTLQEFLPAMIERDSGHVVTVSSAAGLLGTPRLTDYAASKHAVVGLAESLRLELARTAPGVRTTVVCPSYVDTGMFEGARIRSRHLLPLLRTEDVSSAIVRAVERDQVRLLMPPAVHLVSPLRVLPTRWFDTALRLLGITASMDAFVGRREQPRGQDGSRDVDARSTSHAS